MSGNIDLTGKFEILKDPLGRFRFQLNVGGRIVLRSKGYRSKYACQYGVASAQACSSNPASFVDQTGPGEEGRFKLLAGNYRVLATGCSKDLTIGPSADNGAEPDSARRDGPPAGAGNGPAPARTLSPAALVQMLAPGAPVVDLTLRLEPVRNAFTRYRIYAAPRDRHGRYRPRDVSELMAQDFDSEGERNDYWQERIRPVTAERPGAGYEYVMCDLPANGRWRFVSERRYADDRLIRVSP